jgi:hypothetical protein
MSKSSIYAMYLDNEFYAWTGEKEYRDRFLHARTKRFKCKTLKMTDSERKVFSYNEKEKLLVSIPVQSEGDYMTIEGTYSENAQLEQYIENLENEINGLQNYFTTLWEIMPVDKEYREAISTLLSYVALKRTNNYNDEVANLNTLRIFLDLFSETF